MHMYDSDVKPVLAYRLMQQCAKQASLQYQSLLCCKVKIARQCASLDRHIFILLSHMLVAKSSKRAAAVFSHAHVESCRVAALQLTFLLGFLNRSTPV